MLTNSMILEINGRDTLKPPWIQFRALANNVHDTRYPSRYDYHRSRKRRANARISSFKLLQGKKLNYLQDNHVQIHMIVLRVVEDCHICNRDVRYKVDEPSPNSSRIFSLL